MSSIPRAMCLVALIAASCIGCTETIDVEPAVRSDRGVDRLTLDLGLDPLDGAADGATADGAPQQGDAGVEPDAAAADAVPDGQAADGSADAADAGDVDAAADDRQNER